MSALIEHAEAELRALPGRRDGERIMLERDVVALVALFDAQRHSGSSARFVTGALEKLLRWEKLASPTVSGGHEQHAFKPSVKHLACEVCGYPRSERLMHLPGAE